MKRTSHRSLHKHQHNAVISSLKRAVWSMEVVLVKNRIEMRTGFFQGLIQKMKVI